MCSIEPFSPSLAVQLVTRALTACNNCQNHLSRLSVDVIWGASASAARQDMCVSQFLQIPGSFLHVLVLA